MSTDLQTLYEAKWTDKLKKEYAKSHPENCAGPDGSYPIKDASDVGDAWDLAGHAADADNVRARIISIAKRLGFTDALPDTAKAFMKGKTEESAAITSGVRPRKKIATIRVCYLEYNARSLNGRIYPKATCDAIHASLVRKLADPQSLPMTCFVSHEAANGNVNTELVGRITGGVQEGAKFFADIDIADTSIARDQLALIEGNYMQSESMRVVGVELAHDRNHDLPLVVPQLGIEQVELMGIDLTTRPGLMDTARIQQVLYESDAHDSYSEAFSLNTVSIEAKEAPMSIPLYLHVIAESLTPDRQAHQRVHDHLAGVLDATVAPKHGDESARYRALVESELTEEGRAIAQKHAVKLAAAHDESAHALGMACEGCYNADLNIGTDPDDDGIPDASDPADNEDASGESAQGDKTLTEAEMIAALKAKGYDVPDKKTPEQMLQEQIEAAVKKALAESAGSATQPAPTQRQSQVTSQLEETGGLPREEVYEDGDYLKGTLNPKNWKSLADRRVPWPKDLEPAQAVHELAPFLTMRLLQQEAYAQGRDISDFVGQYEQI